MKKTPKVAPTPDGPVAASGDTAQSKLFDQAARFFQNGDFRRAKTLFEQAAAGPDRHVAHSAQMRARMCEHRMARAKNAAEPATPEDHYNLAVALINRRELDRAERELQAAVGAREDVDYFHYALALCRGLRGDLQGAYVHLQRAIELRPGNRVAARNDPDFVELAARPPLRALVYPERSGSD